MHCIALHCMHACMHVETYRTCRERQKKTEGLQKKHQLGNSEKRRHYITLGRTEPSKLDKNCAAEGSWKQAFHSGTKNAFVEAALVGRGRFAEDDYVPMDFPGATIDLQQLPLYGSRAPPHGGLPVSNRIDDFLIS